MSPPANGGEAAASLPAREANGPHVLVSGKDSRRRAVRKGSVQIARFKPRNHGLPASRRNQSGLFRLEF